MQGEGMGIWYTTLESVKNDIDFKETARNDAVVRRAIEGASRSVEGLMLRVFYPQVDTRSFDWPSEFDGTSYRLWLDENELISVTTLTSGSDTIAASDYILYPNAGPPFNRVELKQSGSASFGQGETPQNDVTITGLFGYSNDEETLTVTTSSLAVTGTSVNVGNSAVIGIGSLIRIDSERMTVDGKSMLDTGQNLAANLTASVADQTVQVGSGAAFAQGEVVMIEAEKMLILEIAGNNLIVKRAWDGSTLAAHTAPLDVYAPRTLTVTRAVAGTTAETHGSGVNVNRWIVPSLIETLTAAEASNDIQQKLSGYTGSSGSGDSARRFSLNTLDDLRHRAEIKYSRFGSRTGGI